MLDPAAVGGREVAVIGLGRSGAAATRLLRARGVAVYASDAGSGAGLDATAAALRTTGATVDLGGHDLARIARAAGAVVSPGVPPDAAAVRAAREAGIPVRAEIDLGLEALEGLPYIAVTGTNGKTTVTALVGHLLETAGRMGGAAGNIGTPLCEIALRPRRPDWLSIEFSSFQLHDCPRIRPTVGILTNLSPDHLDRYPTLEDYYGDKRRMFVNAGPESVWVTNGDDRGVLAMVSGIPGRHLLFSTERPADGWYDRKGGVLRLGSEALLPRADLALLGDHNVANALAAALALGATGVELETIAAGLRTFQALPHRLEPVGQPGGVLWINDSKATNVASTAVAIAAMERPFVLLLGGRHKGEPYTALGPRLQDRCLGVVAYGEAAPRVLQDLGGRIPVVLADDFDDVLGTAAALARPGEAVLLSPACSSYDMFRNYEERGSRFRAWVAAR